MLYWIGEKQNTKVEITIISKCIHQLDSAFNKPLTYLNNMPSTRHRKKTSNIQHMPKMKQSHAKNPTMTPTSSFLVSTNDKEKIVTVEYILYLIKRKVELLEGEISELEGQIHIAQTVNTPLEAKIDNQRQYSWQQCLVISGLAEPGEEDEL